MVYQPNKCLSDLVYTQGGGFEIKCVAEKIFPITVMFDLGNLSKCKGCSFICTRKYGLGNSESNAKLWKGISNKIDDFLNRKKPCDKPIKSIIGNRYGDLVVLAFKSGGGYWCRCDCGKIISRRHFGSVLSCSDCSEKKYIGKKYGRLTIISKSSRMEGKRRVWVICKCDCGKTYEARIKSLRNGLTKSCGCLRKEMFGSGLPGVAWSNRIKRAGNRECLICGCVDNLRAHHLWSRDTIFGKDRGYSSMGVCLCEDCHKGFHDKYGYGNNTPMQFNEYKESMVNV